MRILMLGRGVIATIYGWALERAGHQVEFLVRPGRAARYGDTVELDLLDARRRPWGERRTATWPVRYRETLDPGHDIDLVIISVAHHRLAEAAAFLAPGVGDATVLVFGNVWAEPLDVVGALPADQVAWGFPQAGGAFDAGGVLRGAILPSVVLGTIDRAPGAREQAVRQMFRDAGFRLSEQRDFRGWLWLHVVADAALHSRGVPLAALIGRPRELREAMLAGRELLPLLTARGVDLRLHRRGALMYRAPAWLVGRLLSLAVDRVPIARVSFAAHSSVSEEALQICRDVVASADRLGVAVPRLAASRGSAPDPGPPLVEPCEQL